MTDYAYFMSRFGGPGRAGGGGQGRGQAAGPQPYGPLLNDTIHPTPRGQQVLADLYAQALTACPAGDQP